MIKKISISEAEDIFEENNLRRAIQIVEIEVATKSRKDIIWDKDDIPTIYVHLERTPIGRVQVAIRLKTIANHKDVELIVIDSSGKIKVKVDISEKISKKCMDSLFDRCA